MFIPVSGPLLGRRLARLVFGLALFGGGTGLILRSELGNPPWDVLHEGLSLLSDATWSTVGVWSIIIAFVVLLGWIPLRQPLGIGTLLNAVLIGATMDATMAVIDTGSTVGGRWGLLIGGTVLVAIGSGFYIGVHLGPGPRDGLMTGIARLGPPIWSTRLVIEASALVIGWLLGGTFGLGTIFFVVTIGPMVQVALRRLSVPTAG